MKHSQSLTVETPGERELVVTRAFDAPRILVFDAFTKPALVSRWNYGPDAWPIAICEIDLKVGGAFRYAWRNADGVEMGMGGVYREIVPPRRLVFTELFDEDWTGGEALVTTVFDEQDDGRTLVTTTILYSSKEARERALQSAMLEGWAECYDRLDALAARLVAPRKEGD